MDQSVTRTQYDAGTIRKFKRMSCVAALLMVLLLLRGDRGGGVEPSPASPVAKSVDFEAASRDATEATDAAAAAAQLVGTLDAARDAAVRLRGVAAAAAHKNAWPTARRRRPKARASQVLPTPRAEGEARRFLEGRRATIDHYYPSPLRRHMLKPVNRL